MNSLVAALSLLALLPSGSYALCNSNSPLPHRYSGHSVPSDGACPSAQEQATLMDQVNTDIDKILDPLLPQLQASLSPSPCEGLGWTKIADVDMTNTSHTCPDGWDDTRNQRLCGKSTTSTGCSSAYFSSNGLKYSRVCGRVRAYQYGATDAFEEYDVDHQRGLDEHYVDGVVITRGTNPMEHVWTFAAGLDDQERSNRGCPCVSGVTTSVPDYVGQDFFCESGTMDHADLQTLLYSDDPLWDGNGCGSNSSCCTFNTPPYFSATLSQRTCDDLEVRICASNPNDVPVELIELYVK